MMLRVEKHSSLGHCKVPICRTSIIRLQQLTLKFATYKKQSNHRMRQHLRIMCNKISALRSSDNELTDKQQVEAVIRFLPSA